MANDVKATDTINNATIFSVVTGDKHTDMFLSLAILPQVLQIQRIALQQTSLSLGVLWLRCLRCFDVTVGYTNVRTCLTVPSDHAHPFSMAR